MNNTFTEMNNIATLLGLRPVLTNQGEKVSGSHQCHRCGGSDVVEDKECDQSWCNTCDDFPADEHGRLQVRAS